VKEDIDALPIEGRILAALASMSADTLVEAVLQQDYYTSTEWEDVARFELERRGLGGLPEKRLADHAAWLRRTR
jgi:hypothetical protein